MFKKKVLVPILSLLLVCLIVLLFQEEDNHRVFTRMIAITDNKASSYINDDMKMVIEKLLWADTIIWSFPLYYFNVPGKLKTLIDRQLPMVLPFMVSEAENGSHPARYDMSDKRNVLISTCGFYTARGNYDSVKEMFNHLLGKNRYEAIFCGQGELFRVPELSGRCDEYLKSVEMEE